MTPSKMTSREEIEAAVRRAVIEVFTLRGAERPLTDAVNATNDKVTPSLENVVFTESGDASVVLNFVGPDVRQEILDSMDLSRGGPADKVLETQPAGELLEMQPADELLETQPPVELLEMQTEIEATDQEAIAELNAIAAESSDATMADAEESHSPDYISLEVPWQNISLGDTDVKFAVRSLRSISYHLTDYVQVLKRVMQLTGVRIADHAITDINTAKALVGHLVKKPKPKKLAGSLLVNERLTALPNLQIFDRRYTPIDKEKEVGRWKVIVKELEKRGLPVTGTA